MAKKKRRRPTVPSPARPGGAAGGGPSGSAPSGRGAGATGGPTSPVRVRPAEPGGPNRQARKEEARRHREALRRRQARRKRYRIAGIVVAVLVAVAGITTGVIVSRKNKANTLAAAQCGAVQAIAPYSPQDEDQTHIGAQGSAVSTPPPLSTYPSIPPTSGPHDPSPLGAGVYSDPPDVYKTIHSLEHGGVIIWYRPTAPAAQVAQLRSFYQSNSNNDHVIVAPYDYPDQGEAGRLPAGKQMVMVAWHHVQQCGKVSLDAAKIFVGSYRTPTSVPSPSGYKGDAPEAGAPI